MRRWRRRSTPSCSAKGSSSRGRGRRSDVGDATLVVFNSIHFVVFFAVVYAVYRILGHRAQNLWLLAASYYFYAAWDWRFTGLLAASTLVSWGAGLALGRPEVRASRPRSRRILWAALGFLLAVLGFFKYAGFFVDSASRALAAAGLDVGWPMLAIVLPLGISFYTFMAMAYVVDVYRDEMPPVTSLVDYALFVAYFPHLVAGPILRAPALMPQFAAPRVGPARGSRHRQLADRDRPLQEDRHRRQPVADGRCGLRSGLSGRRRRRADRDLRLRPADLRRLRRLLGHGARHLAVVRHRAERQLPLPLRRHQPARVLAALAHQPVDVVARLSLQAARRQPRRRLGHQPQPADHDGARRPVARRRLVVRPVGRLPGAVAGRASRLRSVARHARARLTPRLASARGSSPCTWSATAGCCSGPARSSRSAP